MREVASRRRARRWWWATGIVTVLITVWVFTSGRESGGERTLPKDFCRAAARYEAEIERQAQEPAEGAAQRQRYVERQVDRVQAVVDTAPRRIRGEAETFLTALRRVEADPSVADEDVSQRVEDAVFDVNRFANQGCGVYAREGL